MGPGGASTVAACLVAGTLLVGCSSAVAPPVDSVAPARPSASASTGEPDRVPEPATTSGTGTPAAETPRPTPEPTTPDAEVVPAGEPVRLRMSGVDAEVVAVGVDDAQALQIPNSLRTLGWWEGGAPAGADAGTAVITGHATRDGSAVANAWWTAEPGDEVVLVTADGEVPYVVESRRTYAYAEMPYERWFPTGGPSGPPRLALITCSDYRDGAWHANTVVEAVPRA